MDNLPCPPIIFKTIWDQRHYQTRLFMKVKNDHRSTQLTDFTSNVWLHSSVGRAWHRYRGGHGFESRWSPDFFQTSSFQLLKLENLLRWSFFTLIYNRSSNMNYFIYTSQGYSFSLVYESLPLFTLFVCSFTSMVSECILTILGTLTRFAVLVFTMKAPRLSEPWYTLR